MDESNINHNGGPRTDEGKQVSRLNALKHGLTANVSSQFDDFDFDDFLSCLKNELKPNGLIEEIILERLAFNYLRIIRANKIEKNLIESVINPKKDSGLLDYDFCKVVNPNGEELTFGNNDLGYIVNVFNRYCISAENRFYRALSEFREIKKSPIIQTD